MREVQRVGPRTLLQVAEALEAIVCRCVGPHGGQVIFTKDTGEVSISRDGRRVLASLVLDHPVARALLGCLLAHCNTAGDGAKSFVLLLAALLRGTRAACRAQGKAGPHGRLAAQQVSRWLLSFQEEVLDGVMRDHIAPHTTALFSHTSPAESRARVRRLMEGFFCGRVNAAHSKFLAEIASDFCFRWTCKPDGADVLRLVPDRFPELHTAVTGLPIDRSHILQGLVIHRDFAVHCPTDRPLNALAISVPLQTSLPMEADGTLIITSSLQLCSFGSWVADNIERTVTSLKELQVKLLLSSVKQSDLVLYQAKRAGMSVVECVSQEELSLFCLLAGVSPFADLGFWEGVGGKHVAAVTFCQPVVLGAHRYVHVGFPERQGYLPHCLVLCGPVPGLTAQCVSAFGDAFRTLQRTSEPIWLRHRRNSGTQACCLRNVTSSRGEQDNIRNGDRSDFGVQQTDAKELQAASLVSDKGAMRTLSQGQCCNKRTESPDLVSPLNCCMPQDKSCRSQGRAFGRDAEEGLTDNLVRSETSARPGAVLPVGGAFEFLLHHYLWKHSFESSCPETKMSCRLVAEALLNVPRQLYLRHNGHGHFLKVRTNFISCLRHQEVVGSITDGPEALESLACKYQLLASVLQCAGRLLSVDTLIYTTALGLRDKSNRDDEDDET
ncbi:BBSome complex assembly protein BBS10 [Scleropages formosus]|uniref:BBSome complex assembly protein BBS10 n=1 Tax=Scleropages formosus TaxID=113540 RepID=UPI0010FAC634|nr:Bardet-Biedl syndrome 10 protein [Scleropages formosus]